MSHLNSKEMMQWAMKKEDREEKKKQYKKPVLTKFQKLTDIQAQGAHQPI